MIPEDVQRSLGKNRDFFTKEVHRTFSAEAAGEFIADHYSQRIMQAFESCAHPAMQSDFFRLAYLYAYGGLYIDADNEVYAGFNEKIFAADSQLFVSAAMRRHKANEDGSWHWYTLTELLLGRAEENPVCYFHNDMIGATPFNDVIRIALVRAIMLIERAKIDGTHLRAHTATGPTNLSVSSVIHLLRSAITRKKTTRFIVFDRDNCVRGGAYEYKRDHRNWQIAGA